MFYCDFVAHSIVCREGLDDAVIGCICESDSLCCNDCEGDSIFCDDHLTDFIVVQ